MDFSYLDDWVEEEQVIEEVGEGYRNIWAVAEVHGGQLATGSLEAMGQARELADRIGVYAYGILIGPGVEALGQELVAHGADKVLVATDPALAAYDPEAWTSVLAGLVEEYKPEILLLPGTPLGNDLAPRLAQRLDTGLMSHCIRLDLDMAERLLLGTVLALGGEVYHTLTCPTARPQMATLEPGYYRAPYPDSSRSAEVQTTDVNVESGHARLAWTDGTATVDLPPIPISRAKIVVAGGRGLGDAAGFHLVKDLAAALGGAVAGSRGAFDEGWIEEEQIIGAGGTSIAPDLYIACGIAGDIYHSFGAQDARFVVAINTDEGAPLMKAANLAVVGDARQVIPAVLEALAS